MGPERIRGSLERGKRADFVVWSTDIVACPPAELLRSGPLLVTIAGEIVLPPASK